MHKQTKKVLNRIFAIVLAFVLAISGAVASYPMVAHASTVTGYASFDDAERGRFLYYYSDYASDSDIKSCVSDAYDGVGIEDFDAFYDEFCDLWVNTYGRTESEFISCMEDMFSALKSVYSSSSIKGILSAALKDIGYYVKDFSFIYQYAEDDPLAMLTIAKNIFVTGKETGATAVFDLYFTDGCISTDNFSDVTISNSDTVEVSAAANEAIKEICDLYIEEYCGYYLCESTKYDEVKKSAFSTVEVYDAFIHFYSLFFDSCSDLYALLVNYSPSATSVSSPFFTLY